jgi:hypothetical protein
MISIVKVDKEDVGAYWFFMRDFLNDALKKYKWDDRFPLDMLPLKLVYGEYQAFLILERDTQEIFGALVTETISYPLGNALNLFLLGGKEMELWVNDLDDALVLYAKEIGAKWIDTGSRRGIGKLYYPNLNYKEIQTCYTKEI